MRITRPGIQALMAGRVLLVIGLFLSRLKKNAPSEGCLAASPSFRTSFGTSPN